MTTITITRTFPATPEAVYDAWITPSQFSVWFGGAASEVPLETVRMDATVGGTWSAVMFAGPDRFEIDWKGRYVELDRGRHISFTLTDVDQEGEPLSIDFSAVDGGTQMVFRQEAPHMTDEQGEQTRAGWDSFFDALAGVLER